jgi:hypothetical protein
VSKRPSAVAQLGYSNSPRTTAWDSTGCPWSTSRTTSKVAAACGGHDFGVGVIVGVALGVGVRVIVGVAVRVGVTEGVDVGLGVGVIEGVDVAV